jgi:hypothetical protein
MGAEFLTGYISTDTISCNMNAKIVIVALCAFQVRTAPYCSLRLFALKLKYFP